MDTAREDVLVTIDAAKLPMPWADAVDVAKPLPQGVKFYERKIVIGDFVSAIAFSILFALLGVICLPMGAAMIWSDRGQPYSNSGDWWLLGVGAVMLFAAWIFAASLPTNWRTMRKQDRGEPTRLGIFLNDDELLEATEHGYCLIPRERFVSVSAGAVKYLKKDAQGKDQTRSSRLPTNWVRDEARAVVLAIEQWSKAASAVAPPPLPAAR